MYICYILVLNCTGTHKHTHTNAHTHKHTCRRVNNIQERPTTADTAVPEIHGQVQNLEGDHPYSTVDVVQQQMHDIHVSGNVAYGTNFEHNRDPVQQDEHAYFDIELGQKQVTGTSGGRKSHGTALGREASSK